MSCEAFSPILPGDYLRSSYPVVVFRWRLHNPTRSPLDLSLLLSWRNTCGWFTNTDAAATVHFRDDGSPEHNYCPAIGRSQGQRNLWVDAPGAGGSAAGGGARWPARRRDKGSGVWPCQTKRPLSASA